MQLINFLYYIKYKRHALFESSSRTKVIFIEILFAVKSVIISANIFWTLIKQPPFTLHFDHSFDLLQTVTILTNFIIILRLIRRKIQIFLTCLALCQLWHFFSKPDNNETNILWCRLQSKFDKQGYEPLFLNPTWKISDLLRTYFKKKENTSDSMILTND